MLYRPLDSNWAFGLDANYVKQRDWRSAKDMMKFTDYSVKTWTSDRLLDAIFRPGRVGESQRRAVSGRG